jgi:hypothetical protein
MTLLALKPIVRFTLAIPEFPEFHYVKHALTAPTIFLCQRLIETLSRLYAIAIPWESRVTLTISTEPDVNKLIFQHRICKNAIEPSNVSTSCAGCNSELVSACGFVLLMFSPETDRLKFRVRK